MHKTKRNFYNRKILVSMSQIDWNRPKGILTFFLYKKYSWLYTVFSFFFIFSFSNYSLTVQIVKIDLFQTQRTIDFKKVCCYIINIQRKGGGGGKGHKKFELA